MERLKHSAQNKARRKTRIRSNVTGSSERPRLTVYVSRQHVSAQIIDDSQGRTLVASTTVGSKQKGSLTEQAAWVGSEIAKKAKNSKVKRVVLDRNGRLYHGRIKALADAARAGGLEF